jgi:hypothetical protein
MSACNLEGQLERTQNRWLKSAPRLKTMLERCPKWVNGTQGQCAEEPGRTGDRMDAMRIAASILPNFFGEHFWQTMAMMFALSKIKIPEVNDGCPSN